MKNLKSKIVIVALVFAGLTWYSCDKDGASLEEMDGVSNQDNLDTDIQDAEGAMVIEKIDLDGQGFVEFIQLDNGALITEALVSSDDLLPEADDMSPVEVYEFYKKEKAPQYLIYAEALSKSLTIEPSDLKDNEERVIEPMEEENSNASRSAGAFQKKYCKGNYKYSYCWTNMSGYGQANGYYQSVSSVVQSYRGTTHQNLYIKKNNQWELRRSRAVHEGQAHKMWASKNIIKLDAYNNGGGYHFSIRGK